MSNWQAFAIAALAGIGVLFMLGAVAGLLGSSLLTLGALAGGGFTYWKVYRLLLPAVGVIKEMEEQES